MYTGSAQLKPENRMRALAAFLLMTESGSAFAFASAAIIRRSEMVLPMPIIFFFKSAVRWCSGEWGG